jgi:hypothetical protein
MRSLTETIEIVENAGDGDPGLENGDSGLKTGALLKSHLEFFELVLVLFDLAINIRHETIFEGSFPW